MCCHVWELKEYIAAFEAAGAACVHFDVMDGHFVTNIMLGTSLYRDLTELTDLPVDIHLMCNEPERYLDYFSPRKNDWVSFHAGAPCNHPYRLLQNIRERGLRPGLALDPGTPVSYLEEMKSVIDYVLVMGVNPGYSGQTMVPDHLDKLKRVGELLEKNGMDIDVFVDGNTSPENARKMYRAGANGFVVGTASLMKGAAYFSAHCREYVDFVQG
jgi:ribulose-phosphate 3-epimerase